MVCPLSESQSCLLWVRSAQCVRGRKALDDGSSAPGSSLPQAGTMSRTRLVSIRRLSQLASDNARGESVSHMHVSAVFSMTYFFNQFIITKSAALRFLVSQCVSSCWSPSLFFVKLGSQPNTWCVQEICSTTTVFVSSSPRMVSSAICPYVCVCVCVCIYLEKNKWSWKLLTLNVKITTVCEYGPKGCSPKGMLIDYWHLGSWSMSK